MNTRLLLVVFYNPLMTARHLMKLLVQTFYALRYYHVQSVEMQKVTPTGPQQDLLMHYVW